MCQGARYNDKAIRDATTQQRDDLTTRQGNDAMTGQQGDEREDERRITAQQRVWKCNRTGSNDKGQRDNATTNQTNKQTDEQTNKAGVT